MKKNNSSIFPLLTGILLGGATVYFLKSEKGKEIVDLALKKSEYLKTEIVNNSKQLIESSQQAIDKAIDKSKDSLSEIKEGAQEVASSSLNELENGILKAKRKIASASK